MKAKPFIIIIVQAVSLFVWSYLLARTRVLGEFFYDASMWVLIPLLGSLSAGFAAYRGLSNWISWILPAPMQFISHYLAYFYPPDSAGPVFICLIASVIGAAVGDTCKKFRKNGGHTNAK